MSRLAVVFSVLALSGLLVFGRFAPEAATPPEKKTPSLPEQLSRSMKFEGIEDPGVPLQSFLDKLGTQFDLNIHVDEQAFKAEGTEEVAKTLIGEKKLRKQNRIRVDALLQRVLAQVPAASGATFVLRRDGIEVTTNQAARARIWGPNYSGPFLPLVHATFDKRPLDEALRELSEQAEYNVILDSRAGEKGKLAVTARFVNTPLDTALGFLADMADLRTVQVDNVVYVTTWENAAVWEGRLKKTPDEASLGIGPRLGPGVKSNAPSGFLGGGM